MFRNFSIHASLYSCTKVCHNFLFVCIVFLVTFQGQPLCLGEDDCLQN